jgi:oligoendopeptidase F
MTLPFVQSRWSLSDLFDSQDGKRMQTALQDLETWVSEFEKKRELLVDNIRVPALLDLIRQLESFYHLANRVHGYANLRFAADTQDQVAQAFLARIEEVMVSLQNRTMFFSLWWKDLDESVAKRLMIESGDYYYWLDEMRHFKPYTLSEAEEKIINIKDVTGARALTTLYDTITNRYSFKVTIGNETKEITRDELMVYARHHDSSVRAGIYQELYRVYGQDGLILGQIYQTLVRDWRNEQIDLRHYLSPIAARNLANDIPDAVVETLLDVCQKNASVFQRFFRLKAHILGIDRLRRYDVYAPVVQSNKTYEFAQGVDMVLESFTRFDPYLASLARRVFEKNHLDSEVRKGKRGGAFCSTIVPDLTPWVLVNFQGRPNDVATMAHELGHAVHSMLAESHSLFTQHASLPLAETASTFSEMMLVDYLLANEKDGTVRRDLLFRQIDDAYATIMRQAYFALFERQAHDMIHKGATVDELAEAYLNTLKQQFADVIDVSDEFRWEWVSIPHIYHVPFYVYAYAFGQLLVLSLYQQFKAEGDAFKPRYLKILSAGGSKAPVQILTEAGIDVYHPEFWQGGFDVIFHLVEQLEAMTTI